MFATQYPTNFNTPPASGITGNSSDPNNPTNPAQPIVTNVFKQNTIASTVPSYVNPYISGVGNNITVSCGIKTATIDNQNILMYTITTQRNTFGQISLNIPISWNSGNSGAIQESTALITSNPSIIIQKNGSNWSGSYTPAVSELNFYSTGANNANYFITNISSTFTLDVSNSSDIYTILLSIRGRATGSPTLSGCYFFANTTFTTKSNGSSWTAPKCLFISNSPNPTTLSTGALEVNQVLTNQIFTNSIAVNSALLAPTVLQGDISNNVATTAFVNTAITPSLYFSIFKIILSNSLITLVGGSPIIVFLIYDANGLTYNIFAEKPRTLLFVVPMTDNQVIPNTQAQPIINPTTYNGYSGFAITFTDSAGNQITPATNKSLQVLFICS